LTRVAGTEMNNKAATSRWAMELLYIFLILLAFTRAAAELAERLRLPALVGELLAGITLGVVLSHYAEFFPVLSELEENEAFNGILDLGIFFLLLLAGIEMEPAEIVEAGRRAVFIALGGFIIPLAMGFGLAWWFLPESDYRFPQALFVGTALAITALPVSVKVLMDMGQLHSRAGETIVSAALFDDVFSLILLAVLTSVLASGAFPSMTALGWLLTKVVLYFLVTVGIGWFLFPLIGRFIERAWVTEFEFSMLLVVSMLYAVIAELMGMHFVLGAFVAGLFISPLTTKARDLEAVKQKVSGVTYGFFAPVFFASIGLHVTFEAVINVPLFLTLLIGVAFAGKLLGSGLPAYWLGLNRAESLIVGFGMSGRGAIELIIAGIALDAGLFDHPSSAGPIVENLFSAIVIVAIITTLAMPILLRLTLAKRSHHL